MGVRPRHRAQLPWICAGDGCRAEGHDVRAEVYRVRAGVEANARICDGLRPYVEANVRSDGGSAETGVGLEFSGDTGRLSGVVLQGRRAHAGAGDAYGRQVHGVGFSGSLQVGSRSEGLMVRACASIVGTGSGHVGVWSADDSGCGTARGNAHRTELELGYGVPWRDGTARSIMGVTQLTQGTMYRLGGEFHSSEWLTFSVFGLAHSRAAVLGDIGVNVRGSLQY